MNIGPRGLRLIEHFEGFRATRYLDSGGVPTIGYGTTAAAGVIEPLPERCTPEEATRWLTEYIARDVEPAIRNAAKDRPWPLTQNQFDALCSLGYNLGAGIFQATHTIGHHLRDNAYGHVISGDFLLYEYGQGGDKLAGLVTRREAERALFERKG
jgi:lysozyme